LGDCLEEHPSGHDLPDVLVAVGEVELGADRRVEAVASRIWGTPSRSRRDRRPPGHPEEGLRRAGSRACAQRRMRIAYRRRRSRSLMRMRRRGLRNGDRKGFASVLVARRTARRSLPEEARLGMQNLQGRRIRVRGFLGRSRGRSGSGRSGRRGVDRRSCPTSPASLSPVFSAAGGAGSLGAGSGARVLFCTRTLDPTPRSRPAWLRWSASPLRPPPRGSPGSTA